MRRVVIVNDKMQQGYRYELSASVGRDFDPHFRPDLTPKQMLELGVFCGKIPHRLPGRISRELVRARQALALRPRLLLELFRRARQPTLVGVAKEGLDA